MIQFITNHPFISLLLWLVVNITAMVVVVERGLTARFDDLRKLFNDALFVGKSFDGTVKDVEKSYKRISGDVEKLIRIVEEQKLKLNNFETRITNLEGKTWLTR